MTDRQTDHATRSFTFGCIYLRIKEKERKSIYVVPFVSYVYRMSKHSGIDHTVLPANTSCLPFLRKRSPNGATPNWGRRYPIAAAYYSYIDRERMKGWVSLVGWPIADGLQTYKVTRQLQVSRRTGKVRRPKTHVPPLCHETNCDVV